MLFVATLGETKQNRKTLGDPRCRTLLPHTDRVRATEPYKPRGRVPRCHTDDIVPFHIVLSSVPTPHAALLPPALPSPRCRLRIQRRPLPLRRRRGRPVTLVVHRHRRRPAPDGVTTRGRRLRHPRRCPTAAKTTTATTTTKEIRRRVNPIPTLRRRRRQPRLLLTSSRPPALGSRPLLRHRPSFAFRPGSTPSNNFPGIPLHPIPPRLTPPVIRHPPAASAASPPLPRRFPLPPPLLSPAPL